MQIACRVVRSADQLHLQALLRNIATWLKPEGLVFVHIFTHKSLAYHFEVLILLTTRRFANTAG